MIQKIRKIWKYHRNRIICGWILAVFFVVHMPLPVYADYTSERNKFVTEAASKLSIGMEVVNLILWPILILSGELLDSSVIFDAQICNYQKPTPGAAATPVDCSGEKLKGTMEDQLLKIWVQIRNIVNLVFVVLLLFVALYNVLGRTEGEFVLKNMLPRIVIGLIAVNFSFLAAKVVLDVTNVLTTSLVALPMNLSTPMSGSQDSLQDRIAKSLCTYEDHNLNEAQLDDWGLTNICTTEGTLNPTFTENFLSDYSHKNLAFIITAEIAKLGELKYVSTELKKQQATIDDAYFRVFLELLSNVLIIALYVVSILALFIVLLFRVVILWVLIALSPLLVLFLVIPQLAQGAEEFDFKKLFIQHAIAPVLMVGSMSIGFVILESMVGNTTVVFVNDSLNNGTSFFTQIFKSYTMMGQFLATIAGVVVIWMGVFGAASKTTASVVTDKLRDTSKAFGSWLATTPLYWIRIPVTQMHGEHKEEKQEVSLAGAMALAGTAAGRAGINRREKALQETAKTLDLEDWINSGGASDLRNLENAQRPAERRTAILALNSNNPDPTYWQKVAEILNNKLNLQGNDKFTFSDFITFNRQLKAKTDKLSELGFSNVNDFNSAMQRQQSANQPLATPITVDNTTTVETILTNVTNLPATNSGGTERNNLLTSLGTIDSAKKSEIATALQPIVTATKWNSEEKKAKVIAAILGNAGALKSDKEFIKKVVTEAIKPGPMPDAAAAGITDPAQIPFYTAIKDLVNPIT